MTKMMNMDDGKKACRQTNHDAKDRYCMMSFMLLRNSQKGMGSNFRSVLLAIRHNPAFCGHANTNFDCIFQSLLFSFPQKK